MSIKDLDKKLEVARANPKFNCRFHSTDWWHEVGCPHMEWTPEQLLDALASERALSRVYQHELFGTSLDGSLQSSYGPPPEL